MPEIQVRLVRSGSAPGTTEFEERSVAAGTRAWELFRDEPEVVAARVGEDVRDLAHELADGDVVEAIAVDSAEGHDILRHSTAHVMAQAVQDLFPDAKLGIGPPIEDGFYYDFDVETPFVPEDLEKIESRMRKIIKDNQRFSRRAVSDNEARTELAEEPYKLELIGLKGSADEAAEGASAEVGAGQLTIYDNLDRNGELAWKDLCRGPHLPTTKRIPAFKLMRSAAAYWRGSEKNKQLQRIYGTAWESKEALEAHLHRLEEAERRDHRKLGRELDLFSFPDEIGSGLPVFHPKGGVIKREMEDYVRRRHIEEGFEYVGTPHIAKEGLFHTSGHLPYYAEGMFPPLDVRRASDYRLKAMNCPMHNLIFRSRRRSYRELPLRLFEFGHVYRYEKSGVIHGLTRVRGFAQDDSHSYVTKEQAPGEIKHLLELLPRTCSATSGSTTSTSSCRPATTRSRTSSSAPTRSGPRRPRSWSGWRPSRGWSSCRIRAARRTTVPRSRCRRATPSAAPGRCRRSSTTSTSPRPRASAWSTRPPTARGSEPVMIHSAKFGSIERFIGVLTEHYAGAFPPWLSPVQVTAIPIAERHNDYLWDLAGRMKAQGLRVEVDDSDDRMQKKIRNAQLQKVPFMVIAGDKDIEAGAVSFRYRDGRQDNGVPVEEAIARVTEAVASRVQV